MDNDPFQSLVKKLKIKPGVKHIFLCADQRRAKCCSYEDGMKSWDYLKNRTAELVREEKINVLRTKANCLRFCFKGPIIVIYPDAVWYHSCTPVVIEKILERHIKQGKVVKEYEINLRFLGKK
ncbi:MAG: ferredoxin [Zetaproteobacteria bacterium]|nr:ferredoxin [Pseudobdellovibrionaceae bacterium]|tara:strand:- start:342 stop:710 length:369 start_codon:yes stop_codon:yes gene_type:complete